MNWRGLILGALLALVGCEGASVPENDGPSDKASCRDICPEQAELAFKVSADTKREASLVVIHAKGELSSPHEQLTITALSDYASNVTYSVATKFNELGLFSDSFTLELHQGSALVGSMAVPVEYESYQAFRVLGAAPSFGSRPRQFTIPADVPAELASANNLITTNSGPVVIQGDYANWRIENISDGLIVSPSSGQGPAELDISFASDYQQGVGVQSFHFDIADDHSGKSTAVNFSVVAHTEAARITPLSLDSDILSTTQFEDLSWTVQILDATAGLHQDRQLNWRFVDIPEGFMVEPSAGHTGTDTDVKISRLRPLTGKDIDQHHYFRIELVDDSGNVIDSEKRVTLWLRSQVPMIKDITPQQLALGDQSLILIDVVNDHKPFAIYLNGEQVPHKSVGHFYALDAELMQGESTISIYDGPYSGLYDQHKIVLHPDREYHKGKVQLQETPSVMRYQPSTQSWVYLGQDGIVYVMQFLEGDWRTIQCIADSPIIDIERAYDDIMAISSTDIYRLNIEHDICDFSLQDYAHGYSEREQQYATADNPFIEIDFDAYSSQSPVYLLFKKRDAIIEGYRSAFELRSLFSNSYSFEFVAEEEQVLVSTTRNASIRTSNSIFSDLGHRGATISDDASVVVLANGDVYGFTTDYELIGQLAQDTDSSVVNTLVSRDGSRAWRLHIQGQSSWISEYDLAALEAGDQASAIRQIELDLPGSFTWENGNFLDMHSSPDEKILVITLNNWLWTVPM